MAYDNPFTLNLLKKFEGYTAKPKWDHKQYSVGYSTRWNPGQPIGSREDHERALMDEAGKVDSHLSNRVKVPLTPGQRASLTSFGYNLGPGAIDRILPDINAGNWDRVAKRMLTFTRAGDNPNALVDRRRQEVSILNGGELPASAPPSTYMAANATNNVANGAPMATPIGGAPIAGGPVPLQQPNKRYSKLADMLMAQAAGAKVSGWGDALRAAGGAALGYSLGNKADDQETAYRSKLAEALSGASNENLPATLLGSGDEDLMKAGVQMRVAQAKPQSRSERFMSTPNGIMDLNTMQMVPGTGKSENDKPVEINGRLVKLNPQSNRYEEVYSAPPQPKPPVLSDIYDDQGRKQKAVINLDSAEYKPVGGAAPDSQVGRYRPSKQGIVDTLTGQVIPGSEATAEAAEHGTTPVPWIDKEGNLHYTQLSKAGGRKDLELPEGAKWAPGYDFKDTGGAYTGFNKKTGVAETTTPIDVAGKEAAQERGKLAGQAQVSLPAAKTTVENAFKTIEQLEKHPGIDTATGLSAYLDPRAWTPGTDAYNFNVKNRKAQAQSFMGARDSLKGAGQVTDFEGARGEAAIAALETAQSKEQYLEELANLKRMMQASYDDLSARAGMAGSGAGAPAPAQQPPQFDINAAKSKYGLE